MPPSHPDPPRIAYTERLVTLLTDATGALHDLGGHARLVPDARLAGAAAVVDMAVRCAALDGDRVGAVDLLRFEAGDTLGLAGADRAGPWVAVARRAADRAAALRLGLDRLAEDAPLDGALLWAVRCRLDADPTAGSAASAVPGRPGVPPAWRKLARLLGDGSLPLLVRLALAQRRLGPESGDDQRMGPLLPPLALRAGGVLAEPVLRLPVHHAARRHEYRACLAADDPERWVRYFLDAVRTQAAADERWVLGLRRRREKTAEQLRKGRASRAAIAAAAQLVARPYLSATTLAADLGVSLPTARAAVEQLVAAGELTERTNRRRDRFYVAPKLVAELFGTSERESLGGDSNP